MPIDLTNKIIGLSLIPENVLGIYFSSCGRYWMNAMAIMKGKKIVIKHCFIVYFNFIGEKVYL
jgi:hypothetical protein